MGLFSSKSSSSSKSEAFDNRSVASGVDTIAAGGNRGAILDGYESGDKEFKPHLLIDGAGVWFVSGIVLLFVALWFGLRRLF